MRIKRLEIENCKSYRDREEIDLDRPFSILVGPNGGGKSNTLDILSVVMRHHLLPAYVVNEGSDGALPWRDINRQHPFGNIDQYLDKYVGDERRDSRIRITISVGQSDLDNMRVVNERRHDLEAALSAYRNKSVANFAFTNRWNPDGFSVGQELVFFVHNGGLQPDPDESHTLFREYLQHLNLFLLLAPDVDGFEVRPTLAYFSPYRSANPEDLRANLSGEQFFQLLNGFFNATSRTPTSLIKLASVFFAEKRRRLEAEGGDLSTAWRKDEDVQLVTEYLGKLGYDWDLRLVHKNRNVYEVLLKNGGREAAIGRASSGEKEILTFLLGMAALRTRGGTIIVDEPELHLHPRWQAVLRDLLVNLATATSNQIVVSTHSALFVSPETISSVVRVAQDASHTTRATGIDPKSLPDQRGLVHIVNSQNNERMLFADAVLLVEGVKDRILLDAVIRALGRVAGVTSVVEVVEVGGKHLFARYKALLAGLGVPTAVMADLDHAVDLCPSELEPYLETQWTKLDTDVLKNKKSRDRVSLAEALDSAISSSDTSQLTATWEYIKARYRRLRPDLEADERAKVDAVLGELTKRGTHILSRGEIEDCLPEGATSLDAVIELVRPERFAEWLRTAPDDERAKDVLSTAAGVLGLDGGRIGEIARTAAAALDAEAGQAP